MNPKSTREIWSTPKRGIKNEVNDMQPGDSQDSLDNNQNPQTPPCPQASADQTPTHSDGYTIIPPNESRRSKLQRMAQKELDDLNRLKEENRPGPIHLAPEKLGGSVSLAEVRQRQQLDVRQSKLQKKLKQEELDKIRRQEEEEKNQRMKATQREKANRLEMKNMQDEKRRRELYQHDLQMRREEYLQRLERSSSVPMAASNATPASSWARGHEYKEARKAEEQGALQHKKEEQRRKSEMLEEKQKQQEEDRKRRMESERLRVNSAFLDRLEASRSGRVSESNSCIPEGGNVWQTEEPQDPASSPVPFPSQVHADSEEEEEDADWAVMRLQSNFPYYERALLEDILSQCNGNYQQAFDLLNV